MESFKNCAQQNSNLDNFSDGVLNACMDLGAERMNISSDFDLKIDVFFGALTHHYHFILGVLWSHFGGLGAPRGSILGNFWGLGASLGALGG